MCMHLHLSIIYHLCTELLQPRIEQAAPTPPSQPPSTLIQFASYLKSVYGGQKFPNYGKWPPCYSMKYINLACIDKYAISKSFEEFTRASIHGNIDDIIDYEKHPMDFQQIAKLGDGSWPKLILVEGAPGVGKSTFAWKLCRKWSRGKILSQYKLVVLLRLRDKSVREAKTLYDLIYYQDSKKRTLVVEEIDQLNGKETLLLFEGYDELPAQLQRDEASILLQIISGRCLPEATVLVTSRHSASWFLRKEYKILRISQHIEILGFTKENIQSFINEHVKGCEKRQAFERYLSCYPHIRTMMYIPLNSVIVLEVYDQCHGKAKPAPKTMTELYTSLVRTLLLRYLIDGDGIILETFEDLQTHNKYEKFQQICKTAYDGIANNQQIIFYKSNIPDGFETLDLMQEVHELYIDEGSCVSYNFLHLTIQEYLAAVHLSMQPLDIQIQHFNEKNTKSSFDMVLRFLSGLTKFHNYPQLDLTLILEPQDYNGVPGLNFHFLFEAQNVEYISNVLKKEEFSVGYLSTPFEAYALGYCVAHSNLKWKLSRVTQDCTINEMFIRGLQAEETQCKGTVKFDIEINKDMLKYFKPKTLTRFFRRVSCRITSFSFLSSVTTEFVSESKLCFESLEVKVLDEIKTEHCRILGELIRSSTSLRHFTVDINSPSSVSMTCLEPIVTALGKNTSPLLTSASFNDGFLLLRALTALMRTRNAELYPRVLQLLNVSFDEKAGELVKELSYIHHPNATAKNLSPAKICSLLFNNIPFSFSGDMSFLSDLYHLRKLIISHSDLSGNSIKCITEGFLVHCKANAEGGRSLEDESETEQSNRTCTLEHVELTNCNIGPVEAKLLAQSLHVNTSVKRLDLRGNPVGDEGTKALAEIGLYQMLCSHRSCTPLV